MNDARLFLVYCESRANDAFKYPIKVFDRFADAVRFIREDRGDQCIVNHSIRSTNYATAIDARRRIDYAR